MSVGFGASLLLTASCLTERTLLQAGKFSCIMKLSTTIQSSIQGDNSGLCGRCPGLKPQSGWLKQCWWLKTTASGGVPPIVLRTRKSHSRSPLPPQGEGRKRKGRGKEEGANALLHFRSGLSPRRRTSQFQTGTSVPWLFGLRISRQGFQPRLKHICGHLYSLPLLTKEGAGGWLASKISD